ncbi:MAG: zinc-binding dehydrogenase, partial [Lachnospiraceae bacterium]
KAMGMTRVYAVGTREDQRKLVDEVSGAAFCNCRERDPIDFIMEQTDHQGVDIVFECVGVNESVNHAVNSVTAGGQAVFVGNPAGDIVLEKQIYWKILRRQLTVHGTWNSSFTKDAADDWHMALEAIGEGRIKPAKQITHRFQFDELKDGLEVMRDKHIFSNKVMIMI